MSTERSGSNLLRAMLGSHSCVAAPPPVHIWTALAPLLPWIGPLTDPDRIERLVADALSLTTVEGSHSEWRHRLTVSEVVQRLPVPGLAGVIAALHAAYAGREESSHWVCKENDTHRFALRIHASEPDTHTIYLCRDGRDVAASMRRAPLHRQHMLLLAEKWRDEQIDMLTVHDELAVSGSATLVRYEELVEAPGEVLEGLCTRLGLAWEPAMLEFHASEQVRDETARTHYWENLRRPVMSGNTGRYRQELSRRAVALFERVAGDALDLLGYPCEGARRPLSSLHRLSARLAAVTAEMLVYRRRRERLFDREPARRATRRLIGGIGRRWREAGRGS
jgi:hypothetical protein